MNLCEAQWLACVLPYRRFAAALTGDRARLRGRCGSLLHHRVGLAPTTRYRSPGALRKILDTTCWRSRRRRAFHPVASKAIETRTAPLIKRASALHGASGGKYFT
jgi:hypothetical protein